MKISPYFIFMKTNEKIQAEFNRKAIQLIRKIPKGKIATFGQIAALAGNARQSRSVGRILKTQTDALKLPWHRVMSSGGKLFAPPGSSTYLRQKKLLKTEGVEFRSAHCVNVVEHQWHGPHRKPVKNRPRMFSDD